MYKYGFCNIVVIRGTRDVGDGRKFAKADDPRVMSRDPDILKEMDTWEENDIVFIKGVLCTKDLEKKVECPHCGHVSKQNGSLGYVNPIFAMRLGHVESLEAGIRFLNGKREISNQAYMLGVACRDPKRVEPKSGMVVCQYPIALNRKFFIRADPPEKRTDYPWVKSYGSNAEEDLRRIHVGTHVYIDGLLQARHVRRRVDSCKECHEPFEWRDQTLEIVPYETEYVRDFNTDEDIEKMENARVDEIRKRIFGENAGEDDDEWD